MDNQNQGQPNQQPHMQESAPTVPESELKMPEQQFTAQSAEPAEPKSRALLYTLVAVLVVLLAALAAFMLYGEQLMDLLMPRNEPVLDPVMPEDMQADGTETGPATTTEEDLSAIEAELENTDFEEFDAELEAIDAELEAETE